MINNSLITVNSLHTVKYLYTTPNFIRMRTLSLLFERSLLFLSVLERDVHLNCWARRLRRTAFSEQLPTPGWINMGAKTVPVKFGQFMSYYKRKKIIKKFRKNCNLKTSFMPFCLCRELSTTSIGKWNFWSKLLILGMY